MNGLLLIDKPAGMTSHDVVARVRRTLGERRVGHAGTLDPPATGLLLLGVGAATRLLRFVEIHDKTYEADALFGVTTTTLDADGDVVATVDASGLRAETVEGVLPRFTGAIEQIPPMVSAIKVGGVRLHERARRGEEVERTPRPITIFDLRLTSWDGPRASFVARCSKGTYIRSLLADIGDAVGTGAHVTRLRRTAIGPFSVDDAITLEQVSVEAVRPVVAILDGYPRRTVNDAHMATVVQGKAQAAAGIDGVYALIGPDGTVAMMRDDGEEARSLCVIKAM